MFAAEEYLNDLLKKTDSAWEKRLIASIIVQLQRGEPERPIYTSGGDGWNEPRWSEVTCPNKACGHEFEDVEIDTVGHCPVCGQCIDWSEPESEEDIAAIKAEMRYEEMRDEGRD